MRRLPLAIFGIALFLVRLWPSQGDLAGQGRESYEKRCTGCHALDTLKVGPPLRSIFQHQAAANPKFPYSDALRKSHLVWDGPTLDRWLADPEAVAPGNDMDFRLENAAERAAIVAYLKQLSPKQEKAR